MFRYQQEHLRVVEDNIHLPQSDWEEIEHAKDVRKFDPDWEALYELEKAGILKVFTVRHNEKLVGYFGAVVTPSLHCKGLLQAYDDAIFLHRDYRRGLTGYKLFKFAEKCLKEDGVKVLLVTTTERNPIGPLMKRLGYSKTQTTYEKVL